MTSGPIDLHTHTTYSDGSASVDQLIGFAASMRARAVSITDHDTVAGVGEARAVADRLGVEFIAGVEISADYSPGTMHILGYCFDEQSVALAAKLDELRVARERRNPQIADRLRSIGFDITYDEVAVLAGNKVVGRPHFARVMIDKGYASSVQDAFDRFLKKGAPAYVEKSRLSTADAITLIQAAGGVAVLAHPYQLKLASYEQVDDLVGQLAELGLDGIEAIYSRHSEIERAKYSEIAKRHHLLITGGSDYHGSYKPDINIVTGLGDLEVPYELLTEIKALAASRSQATK